MLHRRPALPLSLLLLGGVVTPLCLGARPVVAGLGSLEGNGDGAPTLVAEVASPQRKQTKQKLRKAAERILLAIQQSDARALYGYLAEPVRRFTTPAAMQERLASLGGVRSTRIESLVLGADDGTVEAELVTPRGTRPLTLILDGEGKILGWELDRSQIPVEDTAVKFIEDLAAGRVLTARSLMSAAMQEEMLPAALQERWQGLQKLTGPFQRVRGSVFAGRDETQQLVLVTTQFGQLTDNLFVILNLQGQVIGVDFPLDAF
ncbi:DUF3887 domain-containing protein [Synechococcus sp. CBW1002]|uniref:DUF3887 domain-containing protein n=1 Tax=Synechococcus sp. CBW1002 TaxID=1353134 RepID=UPI0018CCFC33|nr:DUF3887 domain-containing protein [Synechococcus sp. CBW1002]QPN59374.1 DUF3887 domain-containing protein [Synechococcus sp. CBW1002]